MSALQVTPSERLALSRERLRQTLREIAVPARCPNGTSPDGLLFTWFKTLKSNPGTSGLMQAVRVWWAQQPLRVAAELALDAAKTGLEPVARRHPIALVMGAFALGGALVWIRPWRHIFTPALLAGLLPQLLAQALRNPPAESWIAVLTAWMQPNPGGASGAAAATPGQPAQPPGKA